MNKPDLLAWLDHEILLWESLLSDFGPARLDLPNVNGQWSMKDVIAHLTGWNRKHVARLNAALLGQPEPTPPWPSTLQSEDDINSWIYSTNKDRSVEYVLETCRDSLRQLRSFVMRLPEDAQINDFYRQWQSGNQSFPIGEFFDHFHDDHEANIRSWLADPKNGGIS